MSSRTLRRGRRTFDRLRLRVRVAYRRTQLDTALADGAEPLDDPALALRARQLTQPSTRRAIANALGNLLDAAEEDPLASSSRGPRPPIQRDAVLAGRDEILVLADQLRRPVDVSPQAAALAFILVWDSASPIYTDQRDATVEMWAHSILERFTA